MSPTIGIPNAIQFQSDLLSKEHSSYTIAIENLASAKAFSVFEISNPIHVAIVLGNILMKTSTSLRIFAGSLSGDISSNKYYLESLKIFLNKRIPLTIILDDTPDLNSIAYSLIKTYANLNNPIVNILQIKDKEKVR